jgi:hypothetical protein
MKRINTIIIVAFLLIGCASIVSKSNWPIYITSNPSEADVTIVDLDKNVTIYQGKTPTTVTLSSKGGYFKGKTYRVTVSKEGYDTQTIEIRSTINGWYFGNFLFGGIIGLLIVDPLTGAMWTLEPKDVNLILKKKISGLSRDQMSFSIISLKDVPENLRASLIKIR